MDNKKNTILLTVIAVATLLVAVIGATFAYFTAQEGKGESTTIEVKTSSGSNSAFTVSQTLSLYADQTTFAQGKTSKQGTATGKVEWTAPGTRADDEKGLEDAERTFCYTVSLVVTGNSFEYGDKDESTQEYPTSGTAQLLFNVYRGVGAQDGTTANETEIVTGINNLTYIGAEAAVTGVKTDTENETTTFTGWDITKVTNGTYQIGGEYNMIAAKTTKGATVVKMTDTWTAKVTLVNLDENQNYNVGKTFGATLQYSKCSK